MKKAWMLWTVGAAMVAMALTYGAAGPGAAPGPAPAPRAAAERMVKAAREANSALASQVPIRRLTPEFLALRMTWCRKLLDAQLLLEPTPPERQQYVQSYVTSVRQIADEVRGRATIDADAATVAQAEYAVAEAEYLTATQK